MHFKRARDDETSLGIAPLIDIVFLLLIFFMVTSHFDVATGVRIRLPNVSKRVLSQKSNRIVLVIDRSGQVYFEGKKVNDKSLSKRLEYLVNEKGLISLILQADKDVRHGIVVHMMDLAKNAGVHNIMIAAHWKSKNP